MPRSAPAPWPGRPDPREQPPSLAVGAPLAVGAAPAASGAEGGVPPRPAEVLGLKFPPPTRLAYGGVHAFDAGCVGPGSQLGTVVVPPSTDAGPTHSTVPTFCGCASHVQPEGQSLADEQATLSGEQCDVESVVVVQTGGGGGGTGPPSSDGAAPPPEQSPT